MRAVPPAPVVVHAPGRDGELTCRLLEKAGYACCASTGDDDLLAALEADVPAGALLLAEEVLVQPLAARLQAALQAQPPWSDLPVLVVVRPGAQAPRLPLLAGLGNVSVLVRPMAPDALASAVAAALRARARQFEVRDLLERARLDARRKDEFLAMLAHELRNPLAPIRYAARGLLATPPQRLPDLAAVIDRQSAHMGRLIDSLLDASRLTRGNLALQRAPLDFSALAGESARVAASLAGARGVMVDARIEPALRVTGDATRLKQVLDNLLDNAVKFSHAGGSIRVLVQRAGAEVEVQVQDDGEGMAADVVPDVFDALTQADVSLDRRRGGLGLGLALVRGLVELHGGRVAAASEGPGRGATFTVRLPADDAPAAASPPPQRAPAAAAAGLRVLVAEDNVDAAHSLRGLLEAAGHAVRVVHDGREAVAAAQAWQPHAVVCDVGLPGLDGYDVARAVRGALGSGVRLLAVTGYGRPQDAQAARAAGFDRHFAKPVDPGELLAVLNAPEPPG